MNGQIYLVGLDWRRLSCGLRYTVTRLPTLLSRGLKKQLSGEICLSVYCSVLDCLCFCQTGNPHQFTFYEIGQLRPGSDEGE